MSQIDKAFLSAYAKKRPSDPVVEESRPLVDPAGERLLRVHAGKVPSETLRPHLPVTATPQRPPSTTVGTSTMGTTTTGTSNERPSKTPAVEDLNDVASEKRKTLTSYLEQARMRQIKREPLPPASAHPLPSPSIPLPPPALPLPTASAPVPQVASRWSIQRTATPGIKQYRTDPPHTPVQPVTRPEASIPWSFGTVERGIKATADSASIAARTHNDVRSRIQAASTSEQVKRPVPPPSLGTTRNDRPAKTPAVGKSLDLDTLSRMTVPIQPVWEVDDFLWPQTVLSLLSTQAEAFHEIGLHLQHAHSKGLKVLAVTSGERGVGRSTTALCLAKSLSILGMKIGLFDGDYECPSLVDQLNIEAQRGWQQCLMENVPLDEVAIHSINEQITFFPLTDGIAISNVATHAVRISKLLRRIANTCDMVIIDANRLTQKQSQLLGTGTEAALDATLLMVDAELSLRQRVDAAIDLIRQQGVQSIGLVENFHS